MKREICLAKVNRLRTQRIQYILLGAGLIVFSPSLSQYLTNLGISMLLSMEEKRKISPAHDSGLSSHLRKIQNYFGKGSVNILRWNILHSQEEKLISYLSCENAPLKSFLNLSRLQTKRYSLSVIILHIFLRSLDPAYSQI